MNKGESANKTQIIEQLAGDLNSPFSMKSGAILISGAWGVGKTHFWNSGIAPLVRTKKAYVSLFGVRTITELKSRIFAALLAGDTLDTEGASKFYSFMGGFAKNALSLVKVGAEAAAKKYAGEEAAEFLGALDLKFDVSNLIPKGMVICFDDIERKSLPDDELLGFINLLIEQKDSRVVLIADESKLEKQFTDFKEKVVFLTYKCEPSLDGVINKFVEDGTPAEKLDKIKSFVPVMLDCFKRANHVNLRTLQRAIRRLNTVLNHVEINEHHAKFLVALAIEDSSRPGLSNNIKVYEGHFHLHTKVKSEPQDPKRVLEELISSDFNKTFYDPKFHEGYSPAIYQFICDGYLDVQALKDEISPPDTRPEALKLSEIASYKQWLFTSDEKALALMKQISEMLCGEEDMNMGIALQLRRSLGNLARHLDLSIPDVNQALQRRMRKRAEIGDSVESFRWMMDQAELDDMKPIYEEYESARENAAISRLRGLALKAVENGLEELMENRNRYDNHLTKILREEEVLQAVDQHIMTSAEQHCRFYQFAIERAQRADDQDAPMLKEKLIAHLTKLKINASQKGTQKMMGYLLGTITT